jgi:hypothetical protein
MENLFCIVAKTKQTSYISQRRIDRSRHMHILPPSGITLYSVLGQSQKFQILTKHIGKTINNYETKYMQYENIFYNNSNDGYFIL